MSEHPMEYQSGGDGCSQYQSLAAMRRWLTAEQMIGYLIGSAIRNLAQFNERAPGAGDLEAVQTARHTLGYLEQMLIEADPPPQERGMYYSHAGATGQPCRVEHRQDGRAFIRLDAGGGGFWVPGEKLIRPRTMNLKPEEVIP